MIPLGVLASSRVAAGTWTPASLSSLVAWYDPSDSATVTLVDSKVSQLDDKSGNGHHMTQATANYRPGVSTLNGIGCILKSGGQALTLGTVAALGTAQTILAVFTPSTIGGSYIITTDNGVAQQHFAIITNFGKAFEVYAQNVFTLRFTLATTATDAHVVGLRRDGTAVTGRYDGAATGSGTANTNSVGLRSIVGATHTTSPENGNNKIGEIIVCNTALSTGDLAAAESYLKAKWGTP